MISLLKRCLMVVMLSLPLLGQAATLSVSAASSLTNAFQQMAKAFNTRYPEHTVLLNFAASGVLLQQIKHGAPVDIFASADQLTMQQALEQGLIINTSVVNFASNRLVLIQSPRSPIKITQASDLLNPQIRFIALGQPDTTPNARFAKAWLQHQQLWEPLKNKLLMASNVRQSLTYVAQGEADAGFVFASDAWQFKDKVNVVKVLPSGQLDSQGVWMPTPIIYPIGMTKHAQTELAQLFIEFVQSPQGQEILISSGLRSPDDVDL